MDLSCTKSADPYSGNAPDSGIQKFNCVHTAKKADCNLQLICILLVLKCDIIYILKMVPQKANFLSIFAYSSVVQWLLVFL